MAQIFNLRLSSGGNATTGTTLHLKALVGFTAKERELGLKYYCSANLFDQDAEADAILTSLHRASFATSVHSVESILNDSSIDDDLLTDIDGRIDWKGPHLNPDPFLQVVEFPVFKFTRSFSEGLNMVSPKTLAGLRDDGPVSDTTFELYAHMVLSNELSGFIVAKSNPLHITLPLVEG